MILDDIIFQKRQEVTSLKIERKFQNPQIFKNLPAPLNFSANIGRPGINLIAEIKKKSPSSGVIRADLEVEAVAREYEKSGAAAISVLTDAHFFGGSRDDLIAVKRCTKLPVLRKDFIIDQDQIFESRFLGADAILLIAAIVSDSELAQFIKVADSLKLQCLVEVHTQSELEVALAAGSKIIGINNRDLHNFRVDLSTTERLVSQIPLDKRKNLVLVSESGIAQGSQVIQLKNLGINAILVGEGLLYAENISQKIKELFPKDA